MRAWTMFLLLCIATAGLCDGGGGGADDAGDVRLIEFLDGNRADIARNHAVSFLFLDFTLAIGNYIVTGDRVTLVPRLPNAADRGDTGFDNGVEAVTGPFAYMDRMDLTITVNGGPT
jgi:hypothetical protein